MCSLLCISVILHTCIVLAIFDKCLYIPISDYYSLFVCLFVCLFVVLTATVVLVNEVAYNVTK